MHPRNPTPAAGYLVAAVVLTWPLALHLTDRLGALQDVGDPFLNLWILGWGLRAWTSDPGSIFSGRVFDANIFYPAEGTLAYSDHFLLQALALSPVYLATRDAVLCYNLLVIGSIVASGLAMHALARAVTGSISAAYVAGLAWACWPFRTAHLLHLQLQALYFMPLALLCLHRLAAGRRWRDAVALGMVTALQAIASVYYGVMTAVALAVSAVALAIGTGQWRSRRLAARLVGAAFVAGVLVTPVLVPYVRSQETEGFGRTLFEAANHSASLQAYTQTPPVNLVYGQTGLLAPRAPTAGARDRRNVEHQIFPGLTVIVLAAFGLWRYCGSDAKPLVWSAAALVVTGIPLSLGPEGWRAGYAWLHDNVFGFQAIRSPARFTVIAMMGMCLLAALGLRAVTATVRPRRIATGIITALLVLEYLNGSLPLANAPLRETPIGQWLRHEPMSGAVVHVPLTIDIENTPIMVQSLEHGRPIVNGYSGQRPAFFASLVDSLADLPSPTAFSALREIDVRFLVSATPIAGAGDPTSPLVERARLPDGVIYELRWTPEAEAALTADHGPPPPLPGPVPFTVRETAVYDVHWDGGPVNLPAGRATLTARERLQSGAGGHGWEFEARTDTADWVSSFFHARDRYVTDAGSDLLPLTHVREIREGRRQLDRVYVYDRAARVVRVGQTRRAALEPGAMALPLAHEHARDALTALFYARTLPLAAGSIVSVPINEAGTSMILQLATAEPESIESGGRRVPAIRLEPRLMRRIERRRPVIMTVWLSVDERRVPLRAVIEAGFGRLRLELIEYRR